MWEKRKDMPDREESMSKYTDVKQYSMCGEKEPRIVRGQAEWEMTDSSCKWLTFASFQHRVEQFSLQE
jgi:hypothetical protein